MKYDWKLFLFITHLNDTMNKETEINKQREESESQLCWIIKQRTSLQEYINLEENEQGSVNRIMNRFWSLPYQKTLIVFINTQLKVIVEKSIVGTKQ